MGTSPTVIDVKQSTPQITRGPVRATLLGLICVFVLGGILVAGLWPFHSPKNEVTWIRGANGLQFGDYSTLLSSGAFKAINAQGGGPCSLEIWLEPSRSYDSNTILAFYAPGSSRKFSLHQSLADLKLQSDVSNKRGEARGALLYVDDLFRNRKAPFVTLTSNGGQTGVYVDGLPVRPSSQFPFSSSDFSGELVVGDSPFQPDSWSGRLLGLALYNEELTPAQVSSHYRTWTRNGRPALSAEERNIALYLFDEHSGDKVRNQAQPGTDLYVPKRYGVLDKLFLERPWSEYRPGWSYWKNIAINIAGFIPLGFFVCAYLSSVQWVKRAALLTVLLGCAVSLTIEMSQAYLPTRDSGMTDIFTNTLGTYVGVLFFGCKPIHSLYLAIMGFMRFARPE